ncbi:glycosyltransferase family 2 protein, partial [Candidatus Woesebacteria bacterium]|nr:glycosyltransferase family 2 protein [Candidatus Woesebacteria bacterium]
MTKKKLISVIIPVYNEEGNVVPFFAELKQAIPKEYEVEFIYVDDGSTDSTLAKIKQLQAKNKNVKYISFTRNFGHQYALKAGLDHAQGEAVISLDGDFQHPPKLIPQMLEKWATGKYKIVFTRRRDDVKTSYLKKLTSKLFYRFINSMSETKIDVGSADFRLLDREVVKVITSSEEANLFLRGLVSWTGFSSYAIDYVPDSRVWGTSKYTYPKMLRLALDAITSFSIIPLRFATIIGFFMSLFSGIYGLYA